MSFRTLFRYQALCALALSITSCADSGSEGDLGNGTFGYRCISDSDPICSLDSTYANASLKKMPSKVAVGASFGVAFRAESSAAHDGSAVIVPVSEQLLAETSGTSTLVFKAQKKGAAGLIASRGSAVVEVLHVLLVDVDHVRIDTSDSVVNSTSSTEMAVGTLLTLSAAAADASEEVLAGSLDHAWTSDDPAVVGIMTSPATDTITLRGGAPGETWVRASIGGVEGGILIKVAGSRAGDGGAGGSDGDGGAGGAP